jgi:DNA-binding CsgD family transcriptional regulator
MQMLGAADLKEAVEVLVSFVLDKMQQPPDCRDPRCLEAIRNLEDLCRLARKAEGSQAAWGVPSCTTCLTVREKEVLQWLAAGKTDRDIACILGISPRTVQKHLQRMYEKLGVETRTAAVTRAMAGWERAEVDRSLPVWLRA